MLVPLVLYQAEQVFTAGMLVPYMKKWIHAENSEPESDIEFGITRTETRIPGINDNEEVEGGDNNDNYRENENDTTITNTESNITEDLSNEKQNSI